MDIITGKKVLPVKGIVYGVEGIGKTTFASKWPNPLFIDVENGSWQMDVARVVPKTYAEFKAVLHELRNDMRGYQTLVIDSADWLETMLIKHICAEANITSIEKYETGYGKGWNKLAEDWASLLDYLDRLRLDKGVNILFIGHSKIKRYEPADDSGHDRYTLVLAEKSADVLKKWSDLTLFVKYDTFTVEENGKTKIRGGDKRVMYSSFHPCWDAKNRYGLPEKMDFRFENIAKIFAANPEPETPPPATAECVKSDLACGHKYPREDALPPDDAPPAQTPPPPIDPEQESLLKSVEDLLKTSGIGFGELAAEIERKGVMPAGTPIRNYGKPLLTRIISHWDAILHNIKTK